MRRCKTSQRNMERQVSARRKISEDDKDRQLARSTSPPGLAYEDLRDCDLVIEAAIENES